MPSSGMALGEADKMPGVLRGLKASLLEPTPFGLASRPLLPVEAVQENISDIYLSAYYLSGYLYTVEFMCIMILSHSILEMDLYLPWLLNWRLFYVAKLHSSENPSGGLF